MKEFLKPKFYPILVNIEIFPCLIIGGGNVALQKVESLIKFNANITIIAPKFCKELLFMEEKGQIKIIKKYYSEQDLEGFRIVFSATNNNKVNKQIQRDCKNRGIFLNVVDVPELCDFIIPANITRGNLSVSLSSQGKAPFYTKEFKRKLEELISPEFEFIFELAVEYRNRIFTHEEIISSEHKKYAFGSISSSR